MRAEQFSSSVLRQLAIYKNETHCFDFENLIVSTMYGYLGSWYFWFCYLPYNHGKQKQENESECLPLSEKMFQKTDILSLKQNLFICLNLFIWVSFLVQTCLFNLRFVLNLILQPQPLECWDYHHTQPSFCFFKTGSCHFAQGVWCS